MTQEQILQDHLGSITLAIGKIDSTVMATHKMATDEIIKQRKRRVELQDAAEYIKYLLFSLKQQEEEKSGSIIKPDNKIITMKQ